MSIIKFVISLYLSLAVFDRRRDRRRASVSADISEELRSAQIRAQQNLYRRSVIPDWVRPGPKAYQSKLNWFSTRSRNVRDLDQRKIRRKCINL